jgi:hypothetical protein
LQPFAEVLGQELPAKVHVVFVLAIAFCLGVLVTYAEPAISALRPLAALVSRCFSSRILLHPPASCSQPPQQPPPRALPTAVCGSVQAQLTVWVPDNTAPRITFRRHCLPACLQVDPSEAPYLYYLMNQQQELLVLCIGLGVGVAAVIGTLRFIKDW